MRLRFYDDPPLEPSGMSSIFLAGPTSRGVLRTAWRAEAVALLERRGYAGTVLLPEFRDGLFDDRAPLVFGAGHSPVPHMRVQSYNVLAWETAGIEASTVAMFWMPFCIAAEDDPASLPGFTTRAEVSRELARDSWRLVLGMPPTGVISSGHIRYHAHRHGVRIWDTLEETVDAAIASAARRAPP